MFKHDWSTSGWATHHGNRPGFSDKSNIHCHMTTDFRIFMIIVTDPRKGETNRTTSCQNETTLAKEIKSGKHTETYWWVFNGAGFFLHIRKVLGSLRAMQQTRSLFQFTRRYVSGTLAKLSYEVTLKCPKLASPEYDVLLSLKNLLACRWRDENSLSQLFVGKKKRERREETDE